MMCVVVRLTSEKGSVAVCVIHVGAELAHPGDRLKFDVKVFVIPCGAQRVSSTTGPVWMVAGGADFSSMVVCNICVKLGMLTYAMLVAV